MQRLHGMLAERAAKFLTFSSRGLRRGGWYARPMSETPPAKGDIQPHAPRVRHGSEITDEFARICLRLFRNACNEVITWLRTLGRRYFLEGLEPEIVTIQATSTSGLAVCKGDERPCLLLPAVRRVPRHGNSRAIPLA